VTSVLKAVLVGCGDMSATWLSAIAQTDNLELVGLVDIKKDHAFQRAEEFNLTDVEVGTDLRAVLVGTQPDIVFDCTIPEAHIEVATTALQHGCHVLGEKPLADSMENARKMVKAAEDAGKLYAVIQNRRYDPNIRRLRRFINSGAIGPLTTVNCDFFIGAHFGGFRDRMRHVLLLDMAIHTFDAARLITGADPVSVYCHEWNPSRSWYDHDASAVAIFEMSGGIVYTYRGSWCAEGLNTPWESDWRIIGEQGTIKWHGNEIIEAQTVAATGEFFSQFKDLQIPTLDPADRVGGHTGLIQEFVDSIRQGTTPETICTDNIKSLVMVFAAIESAETGKLIKIKL
jgi:predicted dehydrogenase